MAWDIAADQGPKLSQTFTARDGEHMYEPHSGGLTLRLFDQVQFTDVEHMSFKLIVEEAKLRRIKVFGVGMTRQDAMAEVRRLIGPYDPHGVAGLPVWEQKQLEGPGRGVGRFNANQYFIEEGVEVSVQIVPYLVPIETDHEWYVLIDVLWFDEWMLPGWRARTEYALKLRDFYAGRIALEEVEQFVEQNRPLLNLAPVPESP